ncbi:hypothetical protein JH06_1325 [Blastocystis sp. subtype 4]|uniref:hypothetical protein n=1 Tax=Blastocystis sp. subtype 4 TaxID=944170 RepID=UPI000711E4B1|nr:hypothetical protein JH06_1325 [Blastocystis sp. subtype 4]KNB44995.1 hypothetical protein JH06_1325 [Blastocystis sp. subtype 4]|eukprot:XP_014528438.1 hypothetical protein JH06_1325 [Blastocystis sp. subtype 4]
MEEIVFAHMKSLRSLQQHDYPKAWKMQKQGLDIIVNFIPELGADWLIPLVIQYIKESRLVTYKVRREKNDDIEIPKAVESKEIAECTMAIRNVATVFNNRKDVAYGLTNESNRLPSYQSINELAKILFFQGSLRLCEDIYESYHDRIEQELDQCSLSQMCTYYYYCGRVRLYEDNYKDAQILLNHALQTCDPNSVHNMEMILFFLIPVNMMFGVLPKEALLQQFHFTLYERLSKAIRCGNLRDYTLLLHDYEAILIQRGLYLIVTSLKILVQRTFVKRVVDLYGSAQIPFSVIHKALDLQDQHMTDSELLCMLSLLKYRVFIFYEE